jgi:hypothetical protein
MVGRENLGLCGGLSVASNHDTQENKASRMEVALPTVMTRLLSRVLNRVNAVVPLKFSRLGKNAAIPQEAKKQARRMSSPAFGNAHVQGQ